MFINFAVKSQIDNGHRMVERCLRHGVDPRTASLHVKEADIILLNDNSVGIIVTSKVAASMKGRCYKVTTAMNAKDILAVSCKKKCDATVGD